MLPRALEVPAPVVQEDVGEEDRERARADTMFRDNGLLMRKAKDTGGVGMD